ncbi:MAG: ArsR/SmtB family transcription factor [Candidatus Bathyarchaeia archaeon]
MSLQELRGEVDAIRRNLKQLADFIKSDRINELRNTLASNHLRVYASQIEAIKEQKIDNCLNIECSNRVECKKVFAKSVSMVCDACMRQDLESALIVADQELEKVKEKISEAEGKPCEECYSKLWKMLVEQEANIRKISGRYRPKMEDITELNIERVVEDVLKPISHPMRLRILWQLSQGKKSFSEISEVTGMRGGHLIFHLEKLTEKGLVEQPRNKGDYTITPEGIRVIRSISALNIQQP